MSSAGVDLMTHTSMTHTSPRLAPLARQARIAGLCYLIVIVGGLFAEVIDEGGALAALAEGQRQALAYFAVRMFSIGFGFSLVFFAGFCVLTGVMILRSRPVPHAIGAMMITAGVCYVINSLAALLAPALSNALVPWILLPIVVAELSMALWLLLRGAKVEAA